MTVPKRVATLCLALAAVFAAAELALTEEPPHHAETLFEDGAYHVHPGQDIQAALELAAAKGRTKLVRVHAGTYRPQRPAQALEGTTWNNLALSGDLLLVRNGREAAAYRLPLEDSAL